MTTASQPGTTAPVAAGAGGAEGGRDLSPLDFLLGLMRDPQTPHHLRIRVAHILAPYLHPKLSSGGTANDDPYGFVVDPAVARALRDDHLKLERTYFEERKPLEARVAQIAQKLKCPAGYTALEARRDHKRLQELRHKRSSPPYRLGKKDDAEEAHLTARIAAYDQSDQKRARSRISWLVRRAPLEPAPPSQGDPESWRSELEQLQKLYPDLPPDPDEVPSLPPMPDPAIDRSLKAIRRAREAHEALSKK